MATRRLRSERAARLILVVFIAVLVLVIVIARANASTVEVRAVMPEKGGWLPGNLSAEVGIPLKLHLTSEDVMHGFAVGQQSWPPVDVEPGKVTEVTLTFEEPGTYTYYCTRWCGPNHWRMRGSIEVAGNSSMEISTRPASPPRYVTLGLDIDAPHTVDLQLDGSPSSSRGSDLDVDLPSRYRSSDVYLDQAPYDVWQALRVEAELADLTDADIWDLVAFIWRSEISQEALAKGQRLYADNCAACHGENGDGNGVMAWSPAELALASPEQGSGSERVAPADFGDETQMLGASSALLHGKIVRGGMGTGMPYWGTIFTDDEINALVDYLWTFQFPMMDRD